MTNDLIKIFPPLNSVDNLKEQFLSIENIDIETFSPEKQKEWLYNMGIFVEGWGEVLNGSIENLSRVLYKVWSIWDDLDTESKSPWRYDFYLWAKQFTRKLPIGERSRNTIDNWITVYRDFVANPIAKIPEKVWIPKRDEKGKIIDTKTEDDWELVKLEIEKVPFSKKLNARNMIKKGEMTPEAWAKLADPESSVSELKREIIAIKNGTRADERDEYLFERDGIIYIVKGHVFCPLATIEYDGREETPELWYLGIEKLLGSVRIHIPLEYKD